MDGSPKQIKKDAFSKRSGYMWTGPNLNVFFQKKKSLQCTRKLKFECFLSKTVEERVLFVKSVKVVHVLVFTYLHLLTVVIALASSR